MRPVEMQPDVVHGNKFGEFKHNDMVGKKWGSKMASKDMTGYVYLLQPTPELWTLSLPHRTQILYYADIALISTMLGLQPGIKMVEAGTGSGSFSHSIARSIAPTGKLYSFEFHEERAAKASQEFRSHGIDGIVTVQHRDVCKDGFGLSNEVNAVFLDLPSPWEAIEAAKEAFVQSEGIGRICCFSPCMEQVQMTCKKLHELGFHDIRMFECLVKPFQVKKDSFKPLPFDRPSLCVSNSHKRKATEIDAVGVCNASTETIETPDTTETPDTIETPDTTETPVEPVKTPVTRILATKPPDRVRGHTSFLTFASLFPTSNKTEFVAETELVIENVNPSN